MEGFLVLGFLIGMQHALEADHLAAVGSMVMTDSKASRKALFLRGATWGLGHTITLFAICATAILLGLTLSESVESSLQFIVGIMLVFLGLDVLRRMKKQKIHFHAHSHGDADKAHLHAHSHAQDKVPHAESAHTHTHAKGLQMRALLVGLVHGGAGSGALMVLAAAATQDTLTALGYVAVFGIGSILGMAALTYVATWPLGVAAKGARWLHRGLTVGVAALTILLGVGVMLETGPMAAGIFH